MDTLQVTTPDPVTEAWRWTEFGHDSGLAGNVRDIYEDRDGNIWFTTDRGVQRYDGRSWKTYTTEDGLARNEVRGVTQTRDGAMWFGARNTGIVRFDPSIPDSSAWTTYTAEDGLTSDSPSWFRGLYQTRDGTLWAGFVSPAGSGESGISRFDGTRWTTVDVPGDPKPTINSITQSSDGDIWFATNGQGVYRLDPSPGSPRPWTYYTTADGLNSDVVYQVLEAEPGRLWFAAERGISHLDGETWSSYLRERPVRAVWQTKDGTVWAITSGGGPRLARFGGGRWDAVEIPIDGQRGSLIARMTSENRIWIWAYNAFGVYLFEPGKPTWTVFADVPSQSVSEDVASDNLFVLGDEVWLGGADGAVLYNGDEWVKFTAEDGLIDGPVSTILKDSRDVLWVAGRHQGKSGTARLDRNGWRIFNESDGVVGNNIATGYAAENGDLWFGTKHRVFGGGGGLMRFDEGTWTHYSTESGLINDRIYEVGQTTDGMIWVGTWRGLSRFDPLSEIWTGFLPHPESDRGGDQKIRSLSASRVVWVGQAANDGGVGRFDGTAWQWFTTKDGLVNDGVWEVFVSRDGIVWAATNDGPSRYDGVIWTSYVDHSSPASTLFHSIAETNDGALWMRGMETETDSPILVRHIPDRNGPETRIEDALDRVSSDGIIFLRWAGDDYFNDTSSDELRYQHRMNEEDWSRPTGQKAFTFTGLVHGRHRFEVRAIDRDGNIDPTPAVHGFLVAAPWWRDPVVAGPGLLLIIGILFQSARVVQAKRKLQASVDALSSANNELFQVNVDLQREQAQGMQSSEDIKPVVEAVNRELSGLGLPLIGASIGIHLSETATEIWVTSENGRAVEPFVVEQANVELREAQRRGDDYHHSHEEGEELKRAAHRHIERGVGMWNVWKDIPEDRWPKKIDSYWAFFEGGRVSVASEAPIAEEYLLLIKRFGEVFGFAHSRYKELQQKEAQNRRLAVEASVQRLRAEVQSMDEASDFERILSLLTESLKTVELTFDGCEIDVLDEPVEDPTMELFEQNGFRYTTFSLDPEGSVTAKSYNTPAFLVL